MTLLPSPRILGRGIGPSACKTPGSVASSVVVLVAVVICVTVPSVLVPGMLDQNLVLGMSPVGTSGYLLGTDKVGRDVLALTVAGARPVTVDPIVAAVDSMAAGLIVGMSAAWRGGLWDACVSRSCEVFLSLPVTLLAIIVAGVIGGSYWMTAGVLIVLFAPSDIHMIHTAALAQKPQPYIEATRVLGLFGPYILTAHILPNITPIVRVNLFVNIVFALVFLSGLSYLGLGVGAQDVDWRRQLADGRALLAQNSVTPAAADLATIVMATAINIVGDWFAERKERDL